MWIITRDGTKVAGPFKNLRRARGKADRLDNEYGAYAHMVHGLCDVCGARCPAWRSKCQAHAPELYGAP